MYKAMVYVTLKESVLDPQGNAVQQSLHSMGYEEVSDVRVGKYMEVTLDADQKEAAEERLQAMCEKLLANPVIEDYRYELTEGSQ